MTEVRGQRSEVSDDRDGAGIRHLTSVVCHLSSDIRHLSSDPRLWRICHSLLFFRSVARMSQHSGDNRSSFPLA